MERLFEYLNISKSCKVDRFIPKKMFHENVDLSSSDKKIFTDQIDKIVWQYSLKAETTNIKPFKDEVREYTEIEVISVKLSQESKIKRIADIVMRNIPYPMLLVFSYDNKILLYTAHQRQNLSDSSKITLDEFISTDWIDMQNPSEHDQKFFESLDFKTFSHSNFYKMYSDLTDKISICNASKLTNNYISSTSADDAKDIYNQVTLLDNNIEQLKNKIKPNTPVNERVATNIEINDLKTKRQELLEKID